MPDDPKNQRDPKFPDSPDELNGGLRGRIAGVTRVGPKAMGLAAVLMGGLVLAIVFGVNKHNDTGSTAVQAPPTIAAPPPKAESHFGADIPIVSTPEPTEAPIVLPTNPVPNLTQAPSHDTTSFGNANGNTGTRDQSMDEERKERRALLDQAIHSKIIASENQTAPSGSSGSTAATCIDPNASNNKTQQLPNGQVVVTVATPNPRDFLNGPTGQYSCAAQLASADSAKDDYLPSRRASAMSQYEVVAGSIIPAALITGINSELPGLISAQVREDVYDTKTGKYLLIPKGSRLVGLYRSGVQYGQSRVLVAWTRLIFPDTSGLDLLGMSGADVEGNAGLSGTVDNHTGKIFGAALLTSILSAGAQLSQPQQQTLYPSAGQLAAAAAGQQITSIGSQMAGRAMGIAPTVHIPKGYPFVVIVDRDMVFPGPYQGT